MCGLGASGSTIARTSEFVGDVALTGTKKKFGSVVVSDHSDVNVNRLLCAIKTHVSWIVGFLGVLTSTLFFWSQHL